MAEFHRIMVQGCSTSFFRTVPLFRTVTDLILESKRDKINILVHACSIGAEAYSFMAYLKQRGVLDKIDVHITATDISPQMVEHARKGIYPSGVLRYFTDEEKSHFTLMENNHAEMRINPDIAQRVTFIDPVSYVDFNTDQNFDVVFILNALIYVPREGQAEALRKIASYNDSLLVCTGFYQDTIANDLRSNNYEPVTTNIEEIHNSWIDRVIDEEKFKSKFGEDLQESEEHKAFLPRFSDRVEDFEYKYCSIFRKKNNNGQDA